jgi:type IV pilus assembly protein PilB
MNPKTGLTFAAALRAFLRQDPDIVMVGEIRDLETAEIAVKAAQTGHLVLSTLHTNDAPQTLTRLANMGVPPFNIASSVLLIMAQRLARRLCPNCKQPEDVPREALLEEGFTTRGSTRASPSIGRWAASAATRATAAASASSRSCHLRGDGPPDHGGRQRHSAGRPGRREGVADLRQSGLRKVKAGITSLEEINRVTKD